MRRILSLLLAAAMLLSLQACARNHTETPEEPGTADSIAGPDKAQTPVISGGAQDEDTDPAADPGLSSDRTPLPEVGDRIEGFVVKESRPFPLVGATVFLLEHEKTGAELMYIANSDTERTFALSFFTRAIDNTGLPHVFEHSTLMGSQKYPSKSLYFNLTFQTYNTYMNATTNALYTIYPVSSLSEAQLLKYADYYTDSCLHPMILEDESIFRQEAWRYRLEDRDDELTIEGTVYSEMLGADYLDLAAYRNLLAAAFPGSTIGNESGGDPASIPDMTWESLCSYHEKYYHPSNCCAFLYGDFHDYTAFLKLLDEAFAPYERQEFDFTDTGYRPLTEDAVCALSFPVETGGGTEDDGVVYYGIVCPGLRDDPERELVLTALAEILSSESSPLYQDLMSALPGGGYAAGLEINGPEDMLWFMGWGLGEADAPLFRETVDASLARIAENGLSDELVDAVTSSSALFTRMMNENYGVGLNVIEEFLGRYAARGQAFSYADYVDAMESFARWNGEGRYSEAAADWLLDPEATVLCTTYPDAGAREKLDAEERDRLAQVKASMDEAELEAIIARSNEPEDPDDASDYVRQLQAVTLQSLPEEARLYGITERTGEDGVRYLDVEADVDGISEVTLLLDASALPQEDIHWFSLYTMLLGTLDTSQHDSGTLALLSNRYLFGALVDLYACEDMESGLYTPYLRANWTALDEDLEESYALIYERLYETGFTDAAAIAEQIRSIRANLREYYSSRGFDVMSDRIGGASSEALRYKSYFDGPEFIRFLARAEQLVREDPDAVREKLESIRAYFRNRSGAVSICAGGADSIAQNAAFAADFFSKLDMQPHGRAAYELPVPADFEALVVDSNVQYNGVFADFEALGLEGYDGALDVVATIVGDTYIFPMLRDQYGAYGAMTGFTDGGGYIISYRDPNIAETFAVYDKLPEFLSQLELSQEQLEGYILSSYSYLAMGYGELAGATNAAYDTLAHKDPGAALKYMRALKSLTVEYLQDFSEVYARMMADGRRFTAGGASAVRGNAGLYDVVLDPFGMLESDGSEPENGDE